MYEGPGIYKHYKGGTYEVLGLGVLEHTKDELGAAFNPRDKTQQFVIYRPLTPGHRP